jgi:hypothetical protein
MSDEQQQETPVWHSIVGEGYEPVLFGEQTKADEHVLESHGWVALPFGGAWVYGEGMPPRRRRKRRYDVQVMSGGVNYCRIKAAKPGDCFMLAEDGELVPIEVEE